MAVPYDPIVDRARLAAQAVATAPFERDVLARELARLGPGPAVVVDVGCADGTLTVARTTGLTTGDGTPRRIATVGVDVSAAAIARARAAHPDREWLVGAPDEAAVADACAGADVVWSSRAVQHVGDVDRFVTGCWQLVRPGGTLVLVFPDDRHNAAVPTEPVLDWLLDGMPGLSGVSDRRVTDAVLAATAPLTADLTLALHPSRVRPSGDELATVFDWRLQRVRDNAPGALPDACAAAVDRFRAAVDAGAGLLVNVDTSLVARKPAV